MIKTIKNFAKKIPFLLTFKRKIFDIFDLNDKENPLYGSTRLNVLTSFQAYTPNSSGKYSEKANLTIETINNFPSTLNSFIENLEKSSIIKDDLLEEPEIFAEKNDVIHIADELAQIFNKFGSDKSTTHNYQFLYSYFLRKKDEIKKIVEIGLGTNNTDVISNMGLNGKPGASLRAFKEFCPNAQIYGADIDRRILFREERISTFFVDQTSQESIKELENNLPREIDLFIDDGLHSINANINSLSLGINLVKKGGWIIIEDMTLQMLPVWKTIRFLMDKNNFICLFFITKNRRGFLFAAMKK